MAPVESELRAHLWHHRATRASVHDSEAEVTMLESLLTAALAVTAPAPVPAFASAPYFRTLGVADGLPSSTVWR
jgi:hypothetical protein